MAVSSLEDRPAGRVGVNWRRLFGAERRKTVALVVIGLALASMLLSACGTDPNQGVAQQNQAKLNRELVHAHKDLGIPNSMLQPIESQEQSVSSGAGGWGYNWKDAAYHYQVLYTQLIGLEQTAAQTLQKQADKDIQAFTTALNARRSDGFTFIDAYQRRLDQVLQAYGSAKLPGDFAAVDATARQNAQALDSIMPAYRKLQEFEHVLKTIQNAGFNANINQVEYQQDVQTFEAGDTASTYTRLVNVIDGQITELLADQVEALPYVGSAVLDTFQKDITFLQQNGVDVSSYQQQYTADKKELASASKFADYLTLTTQLNNQINGMALPLIKAQAESDLNQLQQLVNYANTIQQYDPAPGYQGYYPIDYEYSDPINGIGSARQDLGNAYDIPSYQYADDETVSMYTDLRAMLDDYKDPNVMTPYIAHAADLNLLQYYGAMQGAAVVVSFYEQVARFYQDGKLVYWSYVTTGAVDLPSLPGIHYTIYKQTHTTFISPDPPGSPNWYAPTPINFAIEYAYGGFFLHDAWWRSEFGFDTNLPHWDPAAFNGGSHGCVNFPLSNMSYVYNIVGVNEPVILY